MPDRLALYLGRSLGGGHAGLLYPCRDEREQRLLIYADNNVISLLAKEGSKDGLPVVLRNFVIQRLSCGTTGVGHDALCRDEPAQRLLV